MMAIVKTRKPFNIARYSRVITFPRDWTTVQDEVVIALNRVGLVIPKDLSLDEVERDIEKLLEALRKNPWRVQGE